MSKRSRKYYEDWKRKHGKLSEKQKEIPKLQRSKEQKTGLCNQTIWWLEQLPINLRPDENKVKELERLRSNAIFHILPVPNDTFAAIILSSHWAMRRIQENTYKMAKEKMPNKSEKEVLEATLRSRIFPQNPFGLKMTNEQIKEEIKKINSLEELIKYIAEIEKSEPRFIHDIFCIGRRVSKKIDKILKN